MNNTTWILAAIVCALLLLAVLKTRAEEAAKSSSLRWRFASPKDPASSAYRSEKLRRIDAWWKAFESKKEDIALLFEKKKQFDLPKWIRENLQVIDERMVWEFGPGVKGGHRLVITPESEHGLRPLVETILQRAPKMDGWEFYGYRLPENLDYTRQMLEFRRLQPLGSAKVAVGSGKHHRFDLTFFSEAYSGPKDKAALESALIPAEALLGEKILETWIGAIAVENKAQGNADLIDPANLKKTVDGRIAGVKEKLPSKPYCERPNEGGGVAERKPEPRKYLPGYDDLLVGSFWDSELWAGEHSDRRFFSERYSRHGETFCYLKADGSVDLSQEKFADRHALENAMDKALREAKLGAVTGGGTGLQYSYVDLALTDLDGGIEKVVGALRKGNIVKESWILFFDAVYEREWVGVWDDSPAPPDLK